MLKAQSIVADAKIELDHIHAKTVEMLQQYERYRSQYRALAQAQVELLDSESFNIEVASLDAFSSLEQEAAQTALLSMLKSSSRKQRKKLRLLCQSLRTKTKTKP